MRRLVLFALVVSSGCIDLEGALKTCQETGGCGADAGSPADAGSDDAGVVVDAGFDAGVVDAGYDGGAPCMGSTRPRLRCDATPLMLGSGTNVHWGALAANDTGLIAAWSGLELNAVAIKLDGGTSTLLSGLATTQAEVAVDARGSHWVVAWLNKNTDTINCRSDVGTTGAVRFSDGGVAAGLTVAIDAQGAIAVAASSVDARRSYGAIATTGRCPVQLDPVLDRGTETTGVAWSSRGFRFAAGEQINAARGSIDLLSLDPDGGPASSSSNLTDAPQGLTLLGAPNSDAFLATFFGDTTGNGDFVLDVWTTGAGFNVPGTIQNVFPSPGSTATGACGAHCLAVAVIADQPSGQPGTATLVLYDDHAGALSRGAWDVQCDVPATSVQQNAIGVARFGSRIAVLLTTPTGASLRLCDAPP